MTKTTTTLVLAVGCLAYHDTLKGSIPCKVESITMEDTTDQRPSNKQQVVATVTEDFGDYRAGQRVEGWGSLFFPRAALHRTKVAKYVRPYKVQA